MPPKPSYSARGFACVSQQADWRRWAGQQARLYMDTLQHQARVERSLRILAQRRADAQRRAGDSASAQARARSESIGHMEREMGLQWEIARWAAAMGLEDTAFRALRAIESLRSGIGLLAEEIRAAPYDDALTQVRRWRDALDARADLLQALRAPSSDLERLHHARVRALEDEARILVQMGRQPDAERALAQAARLRYEPPPRGTPSGVRDRVRQAIAGEVRDAERIAPLAVTEAMGGAGSRRYIVEFQAPSDRGAAIVDALIDEVMRRLGDALRAQR